MKNYLFILIIGAVVISGCSTTKRVQSLAQKCAEQFPCIDTLEIYYDTITAFIAVPSTEVIDTVVVPCPPGHPDTILISTVKTVKIPARTIRVEVPRVDTVRSNIDQALRQAYVDLKRQYEINKAELDVYKKTRPARPSAWGRIFPWLALIAAVILLVLVIKKKR